VGHTDERTAELKQCLREIISNGELSTKETERVRGRMIFFECYVFGRMPTLIGRNLGTFVAWAEPPAFRMNVKFLLFKIVCLVGFCKTYSPWNQQPFDMADLHGWRL